MKGGAYEISDDRSHCSNDLFLRIRCLLPDRREVRGAHPVPFYRSSGFFRLLYEDLERSPAGEVVALVRRS